MNLMPVSYVYRPAKLLLFLAGVCALAGGWGVLNGHYVAAIVGFGGVLLVMGCILTHPTKKDCTVLGGLMARPHDLGGVPDSLPFM